MEVKPIKNHAHLIIYYQMVQMGSVELQNEWFMHV